MTRLILFLKEEVCGAFFQINRRNIAHDRSRRMWYPSALSGNVVG